MLKSELDHNWGSPWNVCKVWSLFRVINMLNSNLRWYPVKVG